MPPKKRVEAALVFDMVEGFPKIKASDVKLSASFPELLLDELDALCEFRTLSMWDEAMVPLGEVAQKVGAEPSIENVRPCLLEHRHKSDRAELVDAPGVTELGDQGNHDVGQHQPAVKASLGVWGPIVQLKLHPGLKISLNHREGTL